MSIVNEIKTIYIYIFKNNYELPYSQVYLGQGFKSSLNPKYGKENYKDKLLVVKVEVLLITQTDQTQKLL